MKFRHWFRRPPSRLAELVEYLAGRPERVHPQWRDTLRRLDNARRRARNHDAWHAYALATIRSELFDDFENPDADHELGRPIG